MNENQKKKCLECAHYQMLHNTNENEYEYKCNLSKAKNTKCLKGIEDYFEEV